MAKCDFKKPYASEWRVLYRAAIFSEANDYEMVNRIADAELIEGVFHRLLQSEKDA
jgi:hypothetical protein